MATLVVALERGFRADHVVIRVAGDVVMDATNVTTDPAAGIAGTVAVDCQPGCLVQVSLPQREVSGEVTLTAPELTYLSVSLHGHRLVMAPAREGPRYV